MVYSPLLFPVLGPPGEEWRVWKEVSYRIDEFPIDHPLVNCFSAFLMGVGNIAILVEFRVQSSVKVTADETKVSIHIV